MNLHQLIAEFKSQLKNLYGEHEAAEIALWVIEAFSGKTRAQLLSDPEPEISMSDIRSCLDKLKKGMPVQQILGYTWFYGRKFFVNNHVLIPRSETEELVNFVLNKLNDHFLKILDIGTGSGCIPVSLKCERSVYQVYGMDISKAAIDMACKNAAYHEVSVSFFQDDVLQGCFLHNCPAMDVVISNPPYVTISEKKYMHKNVIDFEPSMALYVPDQYAMMYYEAIISICRKYLKNNGRLFLEINENMGKTVESLLSNYNFNDIRVEKDIHNKDRFVWASYKHAMS